MNNSFRKTDKQIEACNVLNKNTHALLYGGSRSGKTTIAVRNVLLRALKKKSRHLITRFRFNHAKTSIWHDTFPKVIEMCFPGVDFHYNKSDFFLSVEPQNSFGGESQIWLGGVDDKERIEKILGNEYSTIYANETSQIKYEAITTLRTRLAENSGLPLRFYYDLNPCGKKHWTYQEFIQGLIPGTKEKHVLNCGHMVLNPFDNAANLPEEYLRILESLPKRQRQRFLDGIFLNDIEGALWTDQMLSAAKARAPGEIIKTVISVDPAVTNQENSDETGIVVASLDEFADGIVEEDLSGKYSTNTWAQRVVNAYWEYEANEVVAEVNQGGDLVEDAIKTIDPRVKVVKVRASKGKFARAEPVSALYEQGKVSHVKELPDLESQLTEWVPLNSKKSPDRLDAMVWALTHLMLRENERTVRAATA